MKIMLCHRPDGAFGYITDGWQNALHDRGYEVRRWDGDAFSWREYQPDLYIGCSGHKQPIPANRNECQVAIHVNPCGPVNIDGINESQDNINWVVDQKPDVVFGYGHENDRLLWSGWTSSFGIKWVPMPCAADRVVFKQINSLDERDIDLVYLGGRWKYKARTIDAYLLPVIKELRSSGKSVEIRGWGDWPDGICSGILAGDRANTFLNSGKIGPCIAEMHTHQYGIDIPERAFKVAACGALIIHDAAIHMKQMIPSAVVCANPAHFKDMCKHYINNDAERIELIAKQQSEVLTGNTYHHRISVLLRSIGRQAEADHMLE